MSTTRTIDILLTITAVSLALVVPAPAADRDSAKGAKGVEAPCEWNPGTRAVSFGNSYPAANAYTAILSGDGKVLTQGKWTESKIVRGQVAGVVRSGEWSAKLSNP
jgi:hypothetical protein